MNIHEQSFKRCISPYKRKVVQNGCWRKRSFFERVEGENCVLLPRLQLRLESQTRGRLYAGSMFSSERDSITEVLPDVTPGSQGKAVLTRSSEVLTNVVRFFCGV